MTDEAPYSFVRALHGDRFVTIGHPAMTDEAQAHDHRTPLQRQEDAEAEAFAAFPKAKKIATMLDTVLVQARNQVRHNGPVSPGMVKELEAIRALLD